jgi:carbon monoxide dehydrogenase subunit G
MQLEGTHTFAAPVEAVWETLMDPAALAQALPGGEQLVRLGEMDYAATMNVRVGPVQGRFEGKIELADLIPPRSYRMKVSGQGAPGFVSGEGALHLEPVDGGTLLRYAGEVQVGGRIAGVSQRVMESTAKSLARQGLQALDRQVAARLQPAPGAVPPAETVEAVRSAPAAPPAASSAAAAEGPSLARVAATTAADVARDLAADYVPPAQQEKLFWALVGAGAMLLFVVLVRLVQKQ